MIGVYAGSFDPMTNGHLDMIVRASKMVDKLYVVILNNNAKTPLFLVSERIEHLQRVCMGENNNLTNVEIDSFDGLTVDYAKMKNANVLIRGIRNVNDYNAELEMYLNNNALNPRIESIYLLSKVENIHISSKNAKTILEFGGDVKTMVPTEIFEILKNLKNVK